MTIYKATANYRKIWSDHFGPIPKDEFNRSYEIHHIDGNRSNNDISNLQCVTLREHYDIHASQGDWGACLKIAHRAGISPEEHSAAATAHNINRVANGTHPFMTREDGTNIQTDRVEDGTHHLLSGDVQRKYQLSLVEDGTHRFLNGDLQRQVQTKLYEDGNHSFNDIDFMTRSRAGAKVTRVKQLDEGKHNFQQKDVLRCINKEGVSKTIKSEIYHQQKLTGLPITEWEWVHVASREAKRRKSNRVTD